MQAVKRHCFTAPGSGRVAVQLTSDFLVGGSNPVQVHMPAVPPVAFRWQGFELTTAKNVCACATIRLCVVAVEMCIPIACTLLTTNYYTMPWGMLRE